MANKDVSIKLHYRYQGGLCTSPLCWPSKPEHKLQGKIIIINITCYQYERVTESLSWLWRYVALFNMGMYALGKWRE